MRWLAEIFSRRRRYTELALSIREHLEEKVEELIESGLSREEAERAARREFGNVTLIEERSREVWQWPRLESAWRDLRFAARQLRRNPGFAATVVLTLALSIGANTAIFSVVNALLIESLPYPHPERIGALWARTTGSQPSEGGINIDGEQWELLRDDVPSLVASVYRRANGVNLRAGSHVQYVREARVSAHYFDVLELHPVLGRSFKEEEDRPNGANVAILSYTLWRRMTNGEADILARPILLKGSPYTVIGVLPPNATTPLNADLYTPLQPSRDGEGRSRNFGAIVRLKDGATWQQADAEINRAFARSSLALRFASTYPGVKFTYSCLPLQKAQTHTLRPQALALMLAAGFILLIACANLAGLAVVHMLRRRGELATRMALGASRWQIQRQLWMENLLLAALGGVAAVGTGYAGLRALLDLLPEHYLPVASVPLDGLVLGFTAALAIAAALLSSTLPALAAGDVALRPSLAGRGIIGGRGLRFRQSLIAGEVALTMVLLAGAGLLIRTLIRLETMPPGFNPNGVLSAKASLDDARYRDPVAFRRLLDGSLAAMRKIPGVRQAAVGVTLPYERALLDGVTLDDGRQITTNEIMVTPGYFETLQIPLLTGRVFSEGDGPRMQPVVVVNRTFARKFFRGGDPVGRYLNKNALIVGVVEDTVLSAAGRLNPGTAPLTSEEAIYLPAAQATSAKALTILFTWFQPSWIVRTAGSREGLSGRMQQALASVDPALPFSGFYSMSDLMASTLAAQKVEVALLAAMAVLALLLSAVGIFALVSNLVAQRTREIGIRLALGSTVRGAMIEAGKPVVAASAAGLILGLGLCAGTLRGLRSALYGVGVYDVPTILTVVVALFAVAGLAALLPAMRVARIDPAQTLREE